MKNLILIFCFATSVLFCQDKGKLSILENTKNWGKEIIKFPIEWAPELKVSGFEELLFSPKWNDKKNDQFWALIMAWNINAKSSFSKKKAANYFKNYFNGLMKPNHWAKDFPDPIVSFTQKRNSENGFLGKMTFFDGFHTGKVMTVNIDIEQLYCEKKGSTILVFRISPKAKNHNIWKELHDIKLKNNICNLNK